MNISLFVRDVKNTSYRCYARWEVVSIALITKNINLHSQITTLLEDGETFSEEY